MRRVVITGAGSINPLAMTLEGLASSLLAGVSGVRALAQVDASALPVRIGGEVLGFDAKAYLDKKDRKSLKLMVRTIQLAVAGARLAREHAGLGAGAIDPARLGTSFGTATIPGDLAELGAAAQASFDHASGLVQFDKWAVDGLPVIPPMWLLNHIPNMLACHVSILNDCRGPNNTITQTDAASLLALGEAYRAIARDRADAMIAGGADTRVNPISMARYLKFDQLSTRNDEPGRACRPFDRDRDGTALGEGAGVVVMEALDHARARGAVCLAEVCSFASGMDIGCRGPGLARVLREALGRAGIQAGDLDHVNANAGGLTATDAWEARGIREALGDVPVVADKGALSHLGAAAGATELIASVLALGQRRVAGTRNCEHVADDCPVNVCRETRATEKPYVLKIGGTERGQCAAMVVRRVDE